MPVVSSAQMLDVARRPQRLVVRRHRLQQRAADVHARPRSAERPRPAGDAARALGARPALEAARATASPCRGSARTVKGVDYAVFNAAAGAYTRDLRDRHHRARDHGRHGDRRRRGPRDRHVDDRRAVDLARPVRPHDRARLRAGGHGAGHRPQGRAHRPAARAPPTATASRRPTAPATARELAAPRRRPSRRRPARWSTPARPSSPPARRAAPTRATRSRAPTARCSSSRPSATSSTAPRCRRSWTAQAVAARRHVRRVVGGALCGRHARSSTRPTTTQARARSSSPRPSSRSTTRASASAATSATTRTRSSRPACPATTRALRPRAAAAPATSRRRRCPRASACRAAPLPDRVDARARSGTTSTATLVATHDVTIDARCARSSATTACSAPTAKVHWLRMDSYATSGTFTSRPLDSGPGANDWQTLTARRTLPTGTGITLPDALRRHARPRTPAGRRGRTSAPAARSRARTRATSSTARRSPATAAPRRRCSASRPRTRPAPTRRRRPARSPLRRPRRAPTRR